MKTIYFRFKTLIKYLLLPFGLIYEAFRGDRDEILILMYHRVIEGVNMELAISPRLFKRQMEYLHYNGYRIISMDRAYSMIKEDNIEGKHIVITFDDGYMDFYHNAYPILKHYGFPSIIYLCPGYIDTHRKYWWDEGEKKAEIMGWDEIRALNSEGLVDFGSHTMDHRDMDGLSKKETINEVNLSKEILEKRLDRKVRHFAYPRGIYSSMGEAILKDYYDTGVLTSNGERAQKGSGIKYLYRLKRVPVLKSDGFILFKARLRGWLIIEELIRRYLPG